jgi:hypothetical protein
MSSFLLFTLVWVGLNLAFVLVLMVAGRLQKRKTPFR